MALVLVQRAAYAQTPPSSPDEARAAYEQGVGSLAEGRFHDAALALERSSRLRPLPVVTYNLALAYRGLGRYGDAVQAFERYLRSPEATASPERLSAIREELAELRRAVVRVSTSVQPPDASLTVDGRALAPLAAGESLALDPGTHVFEWTAVDHRSERRELACAPGASLTLDVRLVPLQEGRLAIDVTPPSASVWLDGRPLAVGALDGPSPPGEHHVELSAPGYVTARRTVRVGATGLVRLSVSLERTRTPSWVLPTALAGTAAVLGALAVGLYFGLRPTIPAPRVGTWDNVSESSP